MRVDIDRDRLSLYQIKQGRLKWNKSEYISDADLDKAFAKVSTADVQYVLDNYCYARFPCNVPMNRIEGYLDSRPILKWLSGEPLPLTERPLLFRISKGSPAGHIFGHRQKQMIDDQCWINTGEVEFLVAFLLRNQETSRCFHVIGPAIMDKVTNLYNTQATANKRELTGVEQRTLDTMFFDIQE